MNDRISIHPKICHGQACISGTRIPVHQVVRMFAHGDSIDTLLGAFSSITREDVLACLDYAASLADKRESGSRQSQGTGAGSAKQSVA